MSKPSIIGYNIAVVKWFDHSKGFGVVTDIISKYEYFLHPAQCTIKDSLRISEGLYVLITEGHDNKRNRDVVKSFSYIDNFAKWKYIYDLWGKALLEARDSYFTALRCVARKALSSALREQYIEGLSALLIEKTNVAAFQNSYILICNILKNNTSYGPSFQKEQEYIDKRVIDCGSVEFLEIIKKEHKLSLYLRLLISLKYSDKENNIIDEYYNVTGIKELLTSIKRIIIELNPEYKESIDKNTISLLDEKVYKKFEGRKLIDKLSAAINLSEDKETGIYIILNGWIPKDKVAIVLSKYQLNNDEINSLMSSSFVNQLEKEQLFKTIVTSFIENGEYKDSYKSLNLTRQAISIFGRNVDWSAVLLNKIRERDEEMAYSIQILIYKEKLANRVDINFIVYYAKGFSFPELSDIFNYYEIGINDKIKVFEELFKQICKSNKYTKLGDLLEFSSKELGTDYEAWLQKIFSAMTDQQKYNLWRCGLYDTFPVSYFKDEMLNEEENNYNTLLEYVHNNKINSSEAISMLLDGIQTQTSISNRTEFYTVYYHIKYLLKLNSDNLDVIISLNNDFFNVCLWFLNKIETFNFDTLAKKFIYFSPKDQVVIIKRLFYLADTKQISLNVEMLQSLTRVDSDLFLLIAKDAPTIPIDVSTEIVIEALLSIKRTGYFSTKKEVMEILFSAARYDKKYKFSISDYFDVCKGRTSWQRIADDIPLGEIKVKDSNNYAVRIYPSFTVKRYSSYYGTYESQQHNSRFEEMLHDIKAIKGRRWNGNEKLWEVPLSSKEELYSFAKKYSVKIENDNNFHLMNFNIKNEGQPDGIKYCEGRPAPNKDWFGRSFYWCRNGKCYSPMIAQHSADDYEYYTLLDFCRILNINTDSSAKNGITVKYGKYLEFSSMVNSANSFLEHLYCRDCGEMLTPSTISNYTAHIATNFYCNNRTCSQYNKKIYISTCFNWKCSGIIDERDSRKCPNGWRICPQCGSCCSNRIVEQRVAHLKELNLPVSEFLYDFLRRGLGHLEKREFFCSKCGLQMQQLSSDPIYQCPNCGKILERAPYDFADNYVNQQHVHGTHN